MMTVCAGCIGGKCSTDDVGEAGILSFKERCQSVSVCVEESTSLRVQVWEHERERDCESGRMRA
jgi:hypothetical protein